MPNLGRNQRFSEPCDLEIWRMTLKNARPPLLSNIKLCTSFHRHLWIKTGVTVWKRLSWVFTPVTLTFDLWPQPFVRTSFWSLVITPENFMMILWCEQSQKGVRHGQTDRRTENTIHRAAWSQLKSPMARSTSEYDRKLLQTSRWVSSWLWYLPSRRFPEIVN